jgi:hypothetical protein
MIIEMNERQRKLALNYGLAASLIGLPAGLILDIPEVWMLSIVGIILSVVLKLLSEKKVNH